MTFTKNATYYFWIHTLASIICGIIAVGCFLVFYRYGIAYALFPSGWFARAAFQRAKVGEKKIEAYRNSLAR